jgi:hypothetical protein
VRRLFISFAALFVMLFSLFIATPVSAQTSGFSCGISTKPIINVTEQVRNDADSGVAGDTWALDHYTRTIRVWIRSGNTYCAVVTYNGDFQAVAGHQSPSATGILTGDEHGEFSGGYQSTDFTATLNVSDPTHWPLKGKVTNPYGGNVVDYQCTTDPNPPCPGIIDWTTKYFTNISPPFNFLSWGWSYHPKDSRDGFWVNALSGNSGDILDHD